MMDIDFIEISSDEEEFISGGFLTDIPIKTEQTPTTEEDLGGNTSDSEIDGNEQDITAIFIPTQNSKSSQPFHPSDEQTTTHLVQSDEHLAVESSNSIDVKPETSTHLLIGQSLNRKRLVCYSDTDDDDDDEDDNSVIFVPNNSMPFSVNDSADELADLFENTLMNPHPNQPTAVESPAAVSGGQVCQKAAHTITTTAVTKVATPKRGCTLDELVEIQCKISTHPTGHH